MLPIRLNVPVALSRRLRLLMPIGVTLLCLWLLQARVELPSLPALGELIAQVSPHQWLGALLATCISFLALGRYDLVAHRHFGTGFDGRAARGAGMAAIALSQTVGFGLITGSFARWRLLPDLRPLQAAQLTGFVAVTFLTALAAICACLSLLTPLPIGLKWLGVLVLAGIIGAICFSLLVPEVHFGQRKLRLPSLTAMLALAAWALIDVMAAGTALWLLLPGDAGISWTMLLAVYSLALGAAVVSSAPGGIGPFELTIYALLPSQDPSALLTSIVAFRLIYFALPALISAGVLAWPELLKRRPTTMDAATQAPASTLPHTRTQAEVGVIHQNGGQVVTCAADQVAVLDSPQCSIALFDPVFGPVAGASTTGLGWLAHYARDRNAAASVYKCSAPTALDLRRNGWKVLRIAQEAVLDPITFAEDGPAYRQLRRKLRQAAKAGVEVRIAAPQLPLRQMAQVDLAWQQSHGRTQGTTMGRFEPGYVSGQKVFLAWQDQQIIGFISFHTCVTEWCLDLVRILPGAPDGSGHALVREAIAAASDLSLPRLSLAAVPDHHLARHLDNGLRRFKTCFAPRWHPRYIAAPSWWQMAISIAELIRLVHRPPPLQYGAADTGQTCNIAAITPAHKEDEQNEIALSRTA